MSEFEKKEKKVKVEFDEAIHGADLKKLIEEASDEKTMIEARQDQIKAIRTRAKDELGVDGKLFNKLFNIYHKGTRERFAADSEEVVEAYDAIFVK